MLEILASFSADPTLTVRLGSVGAGLMKVFAKLVFRLMLESGKVGCVRNSMCLLLCFILQLNFIPHLLNGCNCKFK
jgi:hypothetical protein